MSSSIFAQLANKYIDDTIKLTSEMVQIPSVSGNEKQMADFTVKKLKSLDFDEVWIDEAGNVIGKINGTGNGKSVMLNSHLDTVGEGSHDCWVHPPFSGKVADGCVWGRGASDTKGAFAAQIYAAHALKKQNLLPKGDIYITGVVREEDSGLGSIVLVKHLKTDYAIIGEATVNEIAIGNRGRMRFDLKIKGKSCHASRPERGVNPHFFLSEFISRLDEITLEEDSYFGRSSIAPTLIQSSEKNTNVIPSMLTLSIDYRNVYSDTPEKVQQKLENLAEMCLFPGISFEIERTKHMVKCYTGYEGEAYEGQFAFATDLNHELVVNAKQALEEALNREVKTEAWSFATDGGHFLAAGIPVIGFSPADEKLAHTTEEHIRIDLLEEGLAGYMALLSKLCNLDK
jgi:putative selenium metabolism hydrolase